MLTSTLPRYLPTSNPSYSPNPSRIEMLVIKHTVTPRSQYTELIGKKRNQMGGDLHKIHAGESILIQKSTFPLPTENLTSGESAAGITHNDNKHPPSHRHNFDRTTNSTIGSLHSIATPTTHHTPQAPSHHTLQNTCKHENHSCRHRYCQQ